MKKEKIMELDVYRGIAILAVILIHVTSFPTVQLLETQTRWYDLYFGINTLAFFAVPSFIFVSGLVLFYRYEGDWSFKQVGQFYKKRLLFIIIPYVLWSLLYYFFRLFLQGELSLSFESIREFLYLLLIGKHYTHLYFIIIIIQFYILFPFLMLLLVKIPKVKKHLIWIGITLQIAAYGYHKFIDHFTYKGSVSFMYFAVFFLGAYIGLHFSTMKAWVQKHIQILAITWLVIGAAHFLLFRLLRVSAIAFDGSVYEFIMNLYAYISCILLLWISGFIYRKGKRVARLLTQLGATSFGIYFVHPLFLAVWRRLTDTTFLGLPVSNSMVYHLSIWIGCFLIIFVSWIFVRVTKNFKSSWMILGK